MYDESAVITGSLTGTTVLSAHADVRAYRELFAELEQLAVYGDEARTILTRVADAYRH
jgi:hypothetical protein